MTVGATSAAAKGSGAMRSPVNWALLGLVIERPSYGYELARRFERVYGDVQHVSGDSHIYKALDALEDRSLIADISEAGRGAGGTDRQLKLHYRATAAGEHGYREHLIQQMRDDRRRSQLLVRELAVLRTDPRAALEILERVEEACVEEAVRASAAPGSFGSPGVGGSDLTGRLAAEESRLSMEAKLPWFRYARREFKALAEGRGSP
jgi:DNA-binding PadR family transcriptional regulator